MSRLRVFAPILVAFALLAGAAASDVRQAAAQAAERVLITNDDGIDEPKIVALAQAFAAAGAEVWVVAADQDRSGYSNYAMATRTGAYLVRQEDIGPGIRAYRIQGTPADAIYFALTGPMRGRPPTLVVSGINGGANAGDDWIGSGTVGAARTAADAGLRAIAVSGVQSDDFAQQRAAADWVVAFTRSPIVRDLSAPDYLTISFPEIALADVRGVEIVARAHGRVEAFAERHPREDGWEEWRLSMLPLGEAASNTDVAALARGNIAVVPMRVRDARPEAVRGLQRYRRSIPAWSPPPREQACLLGVIVDDRIGEGAAISTVNEGGPAARAGLRPGDVLTAVFGVALDETQTPVADMARATRAAPCAQPLPLSVLRGGERFELVVQRELRDVQ